MHRRAFAQLLSAATARQSLDARTAASALCSSTNAALLLFGRHASASAYPALAEEAPPNPHDTFHAADLEYHLNPTPPSPPSLHNVKFGTLFTPHMLLAEYTDTNGWTHPYIQPFGPLQLHPAAQVLHYGMTCFEGMKAYRGVDGIPRLFRPQLNMQRFLGSARRLQLATFDTQELLECIKSLISVDQQWLPSEHGHSLYLRPFAFSSADVLGVAKATRTTLSVIMSPVGPYFPSGLKPVTLFVDEKNARAWPGGAGQHKIGANYAPTIAPQVEAAKRVGAQQVLYTLRRFDNQDPDDAEVEESGAMNVFFVIEKEKQSNRTHGGSSNNNNNNNNSNSKAELELVTPQLRGTILPGVTRDSILELARQWGELQISERPVTVREIKKASAEGRLREIFGCGTACVVQPVAALVREDGSVWKPSVSDPQDPRALAPRLHKELLDIQYGVTGGGGSGGGGGAGQHHPWSVPI